MADVEKLQARVEGFIDTVHQLTVQKLCGLCSRVTARMECSEKNYFKKMRESSVIGKDLAIWESPTGIQSI